MKKTHIILAGFLVSFGFGFYINTPVTKQPENQGKEAGRNIKLGAFSISLSVKDLQTSKEFYENLGFTHFAGDTAKNYLIMKNENALVGLFQGMFEGNILTFNPGWDENARNIEHFDDVREIQKHLKKEGFKIDNPVNEKSSGPAGFMITDPDGNVILIDQHR